MHIRIDRFSANHDATLSTVWIDGKFECFGLEDEYRADKVAAETRIPAGIYNVGVRTVGSFNARYAKKFPSFHKGMLEVLDVPNFKHILIHIGNTDGDTAGCLLVGRSARALSKLTITHSRMAYRIFYQKVIASALAGDLFIEYIDRDRRQ